MEPFAEGELAPNTLIHDRYLIIKTIGRGGMGAVYEAVDQRLDATVALKHMLVSGTNVTVAFEREARILANLRHPALPKVTDFFSAEQGQFLVMEFIPGSDLGHLLSQRGRPFVVEDVLNWADQVLAVLEFLHMQNPAIIHRDIKPQNIKLTPNGEIVLLDFGLAKGKSPSQGTQTGSFLGYTPNYAPLEQIQGSGTTAASDLYSLAATLHQLFTAAPPPDVLQRLGAVVSGQPDPLRPASELNPLVPAAISTWLLQGLQIDARNRWASASAMRAAFQQIRYGQQRLPTAPLSANAPTLVISAPAQGAQPNYASGKGSPSYSQANAPTQPQRRRLPLMLWIALGLVIFMFGAIGFALLLVFGGGQEIVELPSPTALAVDQPSPESGPTAAGEPTSLPTATPAPSLPPEPTADLLSTAAAILPDFGPSGVQRPINIVASATSADGIDSTGSAVSFAAANVSDGRPDTAWRVDGDGSGSFLVLEFERPIRISEIQVIPGYAKIDPVDGTNRFPQNRRVAQARLEFSDGTSLDVSFADQSALQSVRLPNAVISTSLRITVLETLEAPAVNGRDFTPISEIVVIGEAQLS